MGHILTDLTVDELNFLVTKLTVMLSMMKDHAEPRCGETSTPQMKTVDRQRNYCSWTTSQNSACCRSRFWDVEVCVCVCVCVRVQRYAHVPSTSPPTQKHTNADIIQ